MGAGGCRSSSISTPRPAWEAPVSWNSGRSHRTRPERSSAARTASFQGFEAGSGLALDGAGAGGALVTEKGPPTLRPSKSGRGLQRRSLVCRTFEQQYGDIVLIELRVYQGYQV